MEYKEDIWNLAPYEMIFIGDGYCVSQELETSNNPGNITCWELTPDGDFYGNDVIKGGKHAFCGHYACLIYEDVRDEYVLIGYTANSMEQTYSFYNYSYSAHYDDHEQRLTYFCLHNDESGEFEIYSSGWRQDGQLFVRVTNLDYDSFMEVQERRNKRLN